MCRIFLFEKIMINACRTGACFCRGFRKKLIGRRRKEQDLSLQGWWRAAVDGEAKVIKRVDFYVCIKGCFYYEFRAKKRLRKIFAVYENFS